MSQINSKLLQITDKFQNKKIGVIGDLMLDKFISGDSHRISPEAPVPVMIVTKEDLALGGAANVANNINDLQSKVILCGVVGIDKEAQDIFDRLEKKDINTAGIIKEKERSTTIKTRIIIKNQHIVRIDKENITPIKKEVEVQLIKFVRDNIKNWDGLIISDYAKGVMTKSLVEELIKLAKLNNKVITCDIKSKNISHFRGVTLITPNDEEARAITGVYDIKEAGRLLQNHIDCKILLTQGKYGMTIFDQNKIESIPTFAKKVFDVTGAGDTVIAVVTLALVSGASLKEAAILANHAAGIVVGKSGTSTTNLKELQAILKKYE